MAKKKRRAALFEVMSKAKLPNQQGGGNGSATSSPRWWFRSTNRSEIHTLAPGQTDSAPIISVAIAEDEDTDVDAGGEADRPVAASSPSQGDIDNDPTLRANLRDRDRSSATSPPLTSGMDVPESSAAAPAPRVQSVAVSVDPATQQISLRLSYTSAMIGGFALLVLIALAILIGKTLSRGPGPAIASVDTRTLRQNPPTPGVMQVQRRAPSPTDRNAVTGANDTEGGNHGQGARPTVGGSTGTRNPQPASFNEPRPPATFFTDDPKRQQGLNYVIVNSFPTRELGTKAAEFLTKNGVPCTIERDLPNWPLPWKDGCAVVGIRGFAKINNNGELETYKRTIQELGVKYAGRGRFNAFDDPRMYRWDKAN